MTTTVVAKITCDCCSEDLVVDESPLHARNARLIAIGLGWVHTYGGRDLCPFCQLLEALLDVERRVA